MTTQLLRRFKNIGRRLWHKGPLYWLTVVVLLALGSLLGSWLEKQDFALEWRYKIYQMMQTGSPRQAFIQRTAIILINDEEYWKGELARRVPVKRDYLAKLVEALDHAGPAVIALDFDLRSPSPDGHPVEHADYATETSKLLETIKGVSKKADRWIILPKTIRWDGEDYVTDADVHDNYDFEGAHVLKGYIQLPFDIRKIPLAVPLKDGTHVDSFAQAIVRAANEKALKPVEGEEELPYGSYLRPEAFEILSAAKVLNEDEETFNKLRHNIVIVGAGWSRTADGRGGRADTFSTPIGLIQGALIHANFVEALLDNRTSKPWSEGVQKVLEILLTLSVAIIFALLTRTLAKILGVLVLILLLFVFSYFSWLNLGYFYDFSVPLVLVILHALYEQAEILHGSHASKHKHA